MDALTKLPKINSPHFYRDLFIAGGGVVFLSILNLSEYSNLLKKILLPELPIFTSTITYLAVSYFTGRILVEIGGVPRIIIHVFDSSEFSIKKLLNNFLDLFIPPGQVTGRTPRQLENVCLQAELTLFRARHCVLEGNRERIVHFGIFAQLVFGASTLMSIIFHPGYSLIALYFLIVILHNDSLLTQHDLEDMEALVKITQREKDHLESM